MCRSPGGCGVAQEAKWPTIFSAPSIVPPIQFYQYCVAIMNLAKGSKVGWAKFYQAEKALHESKNEIMEVLFHPERFHKSL
jgi:hypothetical protein